MKILIVFVLLLALGGALTFLTRKKSVHYDEILPAHEMKKKYHLTAENRPFFKINARQVPPNLRDLIPMAEKWGVGDDIIRDDLEEKASASEKQEFQNTLKGRTREVRAWLDSFKTKDMPEEAVHFMYMLEALDEMRIWPDK